MRTTLVLDDRLLREAKKAAASRGTTLSEFVNEALRGLLARAPERPRVFVMTTFGDRNQSVHHEPRDFASAAEREEEEALRR